MMDPVKDPRAPSTGCRLVPLAWLALGFGIVSTAQAAGPTGLSGSRSPLAQVSKLEPQGVDTEIGSELGTKTVSENVRFAKVVCRIVATELPPAETRRAESLRLVPVERPAGAKKGPQFSIELLDGRGVVLHRSQGQGEVKPDFSVRVTTYPYSAGASGEVVQGVKNGRLLIEEGQGGWFTFKPRGGQKLDVTFSGCTWAST